MSFLVAVITAGGLGFLPFAAQNALALIASSGTTMRLEAEYEAITPVPWMGLHKTASATLVADLSPSRYRISMSSRAEGFIDWFVDSSASMSANGALTPAGIFPAHYDSTVKDGSKERRVLIDHQGGEVLVAVSPKYGNWGYPAASAMNRLEAVDPLTAILGMTLRIKASSANPCGGPLRVFDGKQRYDIRLRYVARLTWNSDVYKGPALKCEAEMIEIAGFDPKSAQQKADDRADIEWAHFILAELDGGALTPPLKVEVRSKRSGKYTFQATKLRYGRAG
ncbi:MAG: hypothetical protein B7Y90_11515 [Alphaproteobacteria bacterium 32-64-14]|nr:MAG: hypothetical protein B7Y90_11515 [Alphaproteobacteria bacterium 32-64-14]